MINFDFYKTGDGTKSFWVDDLTTVAHSCVTFNGFNAILNRSKPKTKKKKTSITP